MVHRSLAAPELRDFLVKNLHHDFPQWPPPAWDFETLNWVAFYYNPTLDVARTQWEVARGTIVTAGESPNPTVTVSPGYDFNSGTAKSPWFPSVSFDLPIETAGKREKRLLVSNWNAESARLNVYATAWQVRSQLRQALIDYGAADRRVHALRELSTAQKHVLDLLVQRLNAGAVATDEISTTRIALVKAEAEAGDAEQQLAMARSALAQALGVPVSALADQQLSDAGVATGQVLSPQELYAARQLSLENRADILSALATYQASQATLQLEIAKQWPDVHVGSGYLYDLGENKWDLTIGVELPVINMNEGPIAEATASRRAAAAQLIALQARVIGEIDTAAAAAAAANATVASLRQVSGELQQHLDRMRAQLDAGEADQLDYQTSVLDLNTGAVALIEAQARAATATGQLEDAFQVPFADLAPLEIAAHALTSSAPSP